jgi:hypothetical protein
VVRPEAGNVIPGTGGLRKLRWKLPGGGKQGSLRIIYYWDVSSATIYMLLAYKKSKQEDLAQDQVKILRKLVEEWLQ